MKGFLSVVGESIDERESRKFKEGLDSKVKLSLYRTFCKAVEFKAYLHGECDAGSRLMFKFRSGTHGLNEELGRHRGREGRKECLLCDDECESVSHVLWDCPVYNTLRNDFLCKLQELLGDRYEHFDSLDSFEKASFVLGSELWEDDFSSMLDLVKDYIVDVWELRKARLYGENLSVPQSQCQNSSGASGVCRGGSRGFDRTPLFAAQRTQYRLTSYARCNGVGRVLLLVERALSLLIPIFSGVKCH